MPARPRTTTRPYRITSPAQIRALASPVRQEIADALDAAGPCSVAQLAVHTGRPADSLYFHLRRLVAVGLAIERSPRRNGRHVAAVYDLPGRPLRLSYGGRIPPAAIHAVIAAALRLGSRDFARALASNDVVTDGPHRTLWGGRAKGWLSPEQLDEANRLIARLLALFQSGRPHAGPKGARGARLPQTISFVIAPVTPRAPARRPRQGARS